MALKAYVSTVYDDWLGGCMLIFAPTPNKAKYTAFIEYPFLDMIAYKDVRVRRVPEMDQYAEGETEYAIHTNNDLPEGVKFYTNN